MQERSIFYIIFKFWELTTLAKEKDEDLVVLLLDFEKAYDRVDWCFLEKVMLHLGFPMAWVVAVRALYKNVSSSVYVAPSLFQGRLGKGVPWPLSYTY